MLNNFAIANTSAGSSSSFAPRLLTTSTRETSDVDWAVAAAVAGVLGFGTAFVFFICSVCQAQSFSACMAAVVNWWTTGC